MRNNVNKGSSMNLVPRMAGRPTAGPESKSVVVGAAKGLESGSRTVDSRTAAQRDFFES